MEHEHAGKPTEIIACPQPGCLAPAEVADRFVLASTDGPVEHAVTWCLEGHGFTPPAESPATPRDQRLRRGRPPTGWRPGVAQAPVATSQMNT
jgi:hypothetical protein